MMVPPLRDQTRRLVQNNDRTVYKDNMITFQNISYTDSSVYQIQRSILEHPERQVGRGSK
jgi:hypothetical protein